MREAERGAERSSSESWEKVGRRGRGGGRGARDRPEVHWAGCANPDLARPDRGPGTPGAGPNPADPGAEKHTQQRGEPPRGAHDFLADFGFFWISPLPPSWRRGPCSGEALEDGGWPWGSGDSDLSLDNPGVNVHTIIQQTKYSIWGLNYALNLALTSAGRT